MNVLLIGSGGREHALARALVASPRLDRLFVAPGNPGIGDIAENVTLAVADHAAVVDFCRLMHIGLVVVGPEAPLVAGLVDDLERAGIPAFGPSKGAAQLEGSKGFTKDLCAEFGIPTAAYRRFAEKAPALAYVRERGAPIVVKADGLAAGKGVVVAMTLPEAEAALDLVFGGAFGAAGAEKPRSSRSATARGRWPSPPRRTTSASMTATRGRTPAAWAPIRPRPWSRTRSSPASWPRL